MPQWGQVSAYSDTDSPHSQQFVKAIVCSTLLIKPLHRRLGGRGLDGVAEHDLRAAAGCGNQVLEVGCSGIAAVHELLSRGPGWWESSADESKERGMTLKSCQLRE